MNEKHMVTYLQAGLRPVSPRPEYVRDLRQRLMREKDAKASMSKPELVKFSLITVAGLLSGTVLLVFGFRAVMALLESRGVFQQIKEQMQQRRATRLNPVA
ncbi:hypothetical protein EHM76_01920 [bacterium]|nr:MAG: hypothetical protein EHM76_01920 [bacterium]